MGRNLLSRRGALHLLGAGGLLAGGALPARLAFAAAPGQPDPAGTRLVVLMLRGALDGLAAVPAPGDPAHAALRPAAEGAPAALPLGDMFALHPALARLHHWCGEGSLLVLHAIGSPYRERSHFDAQQQLESGGERPYALATGWLGRALQLRGDRAVALSSAMPVALRGAERASTWTPTRASAPAGRDDLLARVAELYREDPALQQAFAQATGQPAMGMAMDGGGQGAFVALARQAGSFLAAPDGPRIAWLESGGWDTHAQQAPRLARLLAGLDAGLQALRDGLGAAWAHSTVLVMTEFGRSAVPNGTGGTDHGTGGVALLAGGAVAGGRVLADWPGLAPAQLFDGRDLRPTQDLRGVLAAVLQRQFRLDRAQLAQVLPGVSQAREGLWRAG